ncbi:MAG: PAS domain S-box protein [Bacteroidetes bacterium]|nr:PAS domain S-box protein [Bacteroidota bacterium]
MKSGLQKQIFPWFPLVIFIVLVAGIIPIGFYYYKIQKRDIIEEKHNELRAITNLKAGQITGWRNERTNDGRLIFGDPLISRAVTDFFVGRNKEKQKSALLAIMKSYTMHFDYSNLILLDNQMNICFSLIPGDSLVCTYLLPFIREAKQKKKVMLSDLYRKSGNYKACLDLIVPVVNADDPGKSPAGLLLLKLNPYQTLYPLIQTWPFPSKTSETLLIRQEGDKVLYLNELRHRKNTALTFQLLVSDKHLPAALAVKGVEGIQEGIDYRNIPVLSCIKALPPSAWYLIAKVDISEVYAPLRKQMAAVVAMVLLIIFTIGALTGFWWRSQRMQFYRNQYERESEKLALAQHFQYIVKYANDIIILFDNDLNIIDFNDRALETYGYSREELSSLRLVDLVSSDLLADLPDDLNKLRTEEAALYETVHRRKDGSVFPVEVSARIVKVEGTWYLQNIGRDITERRQAEDKVKQLNLELEQRVIQRTRQFETANKELEAFTYTVSHDLRAPVRAIDGFTRILLEDSGHLLDDKALSNFKLIRANAALMGQLIDDLLAFSHIGRSELKLSTLNMAEMVQAVFADQTNAVQKEGIRFIVQSLSEISGDANMIRQVWINLISNAIKYSSRCAEPEILIGSEKNEYETIYFVKDNGVGFNMKYVGKLFEVFQRLQSTDEFEGTGVGLAIVKRIVSRHGGRVWAVGELGKGATFSFSLPG